MRYRKLDQDGDMQFGHGAGDFWHNVPDGVGQSVKTRLLLFAGEWFLDTTAGTPWGGFPLNDLVVKQGRILGMHTQMLSDAVLRERILQTNGVTAILTYGSFLDPSTRAYSVNATIDTIYGRAFTLSINAPQGKQPTIHTGPVVNAVMPQSLPTGPLLRRLPSPSRF
jgi:hypothetical protein